MTTTINKTDGTVLTNIADGAIDVSTTELSLIGKLYRNYGELVNENFVKLLENFSSAAIPNAPVVGQLWYNTTDKKINVYRNTGFSSLGVLNSSASEPTNPSLGDLWWDTVDEQLKLYNATNWTTIAPGYTQSQAKSGAIVESIRDTLNATHVITKVYQGGGVVATFSDDDEYFPSDSINGFYSIKKGITLSSDPGIKLHGTVTVAETISGGFTGTQFLRNDANSTAVGTISITNSVPLVLGPAGDLTVTVSGSTVNLAKTNTGNIDIRNNTGAVIARFAENQQILSSNGSAAAPAYSFISDTDTGVYLDNTGVLGLSAAGAANIKISASGIALDATTTSESVVPAADGIYDLGSSSTKYSNVYADTLNGTAVEALYADLAEKYTTAEELPAGTAVAVCAHEDHEVEPASASDFCIGVVSTNPAYMMNSEADGQYIGLKGRLPVRVKGAVKKGQAVYAMADGVSTTIATTALVGVALESTADENEKLVECVLKV